MDKLVFLLIIILMKKIKIHLVKGLNSTNVVENELGDLH